MRDAGPLDAGTRDAGTRDAGTSDAGIPTECELYPRALHCGGFEDGFVEDGWSTSADGTTAFVRRTTTEVRRGMYALEASAAIGGQRAVVYRNFDGVGEGETLWVRFHFRTATLPNANTSLMGLHATGAGSVAVDLNLRSDGRLAIWNPWQGSNVYGPPVSAARWTCVEVAILNDAAEGAISLYVDSALVAQATDVSTYPGGDYGTIQLGIDWMDDVHPGIQLAFDDVVIARERPHCVPPS